MAVRTFNGTADFIRCGGTLGAVANGAFSLIMLVRPTVISSGDRPYMSCGTTVTAAAIYNTTNDLLWASSAGDSLGDVTVAATTWQIVGMSKAAGTVTPTIHRKTLGSGSWEHDAGSTTVANHATVCTSIYFARFNDTAVFGSLSIAVAAIFSTQLSDANFETIETAASTASIASFSPVGLWELNQASIATPVTDLVGDSHQAAITGTTATGGIDPAWTYGLAAWDPEVDSLKTMHLVAAPRL